MARFAIMWIYGASPLLYDGKLYVQVLQRSPAPPDYPGIGGSGGDRESYLLALDPANARRCGSTSARQMRAWNPWKATPLQCRTWVPMERRSCCSPAATRSRDMIPQLARSFGAGWG
jgi:hypothetical protein